MSRTLEITVISAENLRVHRRRPVRKNAFAVVKLDPFNVRNSTPDERGGSYPTWNEKFEMEMTMHVKFIFIEVFYRTSSGRDKKVGDTKIPVTDFMGRSYSPEGYLNFLSYRLWDEWGDRNGIVNVSVRVLKTDDAGFGSVVQRRTTTVAAAKVDYDGACASQSAGFWRSAKETNLTAGGYSDRTVTGVPIWSAYQPRNYFRQGGN